MILKHIHYHFPAMFWIPFQDLLHRIRIEVKGLKRKISQKRRNSFWQFHDFENSFTIKNFNLNGIKYKPFYFSGCRNHIPLMTRLQAQIMNLIGGKTNHSRPGIDQEIHFWINRNICSVFLSRTNRNPKPLMFLLISRMSPWLLKIPNAL